MTGPRAATGPQPGCRRRQSWRRAACYLTLLLVHNRLTFLEALVTSPPQRRTTTTTVTTLQNRPPTLLWSMKNYPLASGPPKVEQLFSCDEMDVDTEPPSSIDRRPNGNNDSLLSNRRAFFGTLISTTGMMIMVTHSPERCEATESNLPPSNLSTFSSSSSSSSSTTTTISSSLTLTTPVSPSETTTTSSAVDWNQIWRKARQKAVGGGRAGAAAAVVQVLSLMWLRTTMNYQYRYGGSLFTSLQTLWSQGGLPRLYQGLPFTLIQGPLTRFGDTAANTGIMALLETLPSTMNLPLPLLTAAGSISAGLWRILLMPIDCSKTAMQVEGTEGLPRLWNSVLQQGPGPLYRGAWAQAAATAVGHFPWFLTYNYLNDQLPVVAASDDLLLSLMRSALLGLCASCVSDCTSNSLRVIKTTKQTAQLGSDDASGQKDLSYPQVVAMIVEKDGIKGLLGRGLQTRLLTNMIQGAAFSVLWKYFQQV